MAIFSGSVKLKTTGQQVKVSSGASKMVTLLAKTGNTGSVWVGGKSETETKAKAEEVPGGAFPLVAGSSVGMNLTDIGMLWVVGTENDVVYYLLGGNVA